MKKQNLVFSSGKLSKNVTFAFPQRCAYHLIFFVKWYQYLPLFVTETNDSHIPFHSSYVTSIGSHGRVKLRRWTMSDSSDNWHTITLVHAKCRCPQAIYPFSNFVQALLFSYFNRLLIFDELFSNSNWFWYHETQWSLVDTNRIVS